MDGDLASGLPATSIVPPDQSSFYEPLPTSTSFRLLHFSQAAGENEDGDRNKLQNLECNLEVHDLNCHPPYQALSYTWEQPYYTSPDVDKPQFEFTVFEYWIHCDQKVFRMTKNLFNALTALANALKIEYLWVDAVCINQADVHRERSQQVSLMGRIFESADEVLIWLGHYTDYVLDFHWSATTFVGMIEQLIEDRGREEVMKRSMHDSTFTDLFGGLASLIHLKKAMDFYGRCRIFDRAWIVQEFAKATNPRIFCGSIEMPTEGLARLGQLFRIASWHTDLSQRQDFGDVHLDTPYMERLLCVSFKTWMMFRAHTRQPSASPAAFTQGRYMQVAGETEPASQRAFEWLLCGVYHLHAFRASDPRDIIFAALSFGVHDSTHAVEHMATPSYSASVETIYTDFAVEMLRQLPGLSLFRYLDNSKGRLRSKWPSWVRDWRFQTSQSITFMPLEPKVWGIVGTNHETHNECIRIDPEKKQLTVAGIRVSPVEALARSEERPLYEYNFASLLDEFKLCYPLPRLYRFSFTEPESRITALWRTLIFNCDTTSDSMPSPEEWKSMSYACVTYQFATGLRDSEPGLARDTAVEELRKLYDELDEEVVAGEIPSPEEVKHIALLSAQSQEWSQLHTDKELWMMYEQARQFQTSRDQRGRQLFRAENGMLGSGLTIARPGDEIWLLRGMNVPMILRPTGTPDQFKVVGECYLHDCMDGELFVHGYLDRNSAKPIVIV